jgi:aspartate kinase
MPIQDILKREFIESDSYRSNRTGFYGATVIHPKHCSRFKKGNSFVCKIVYKPIANGTSVSKGVDLEPYLPCFIVKRNQL